MATLNRFSVLDGYYPELSDPTPKRPRGSVNIAETKYVVIKRANEEENFKKVSVFLIQKALEGISTQFDKAERMRDGSLLVKTKNQAGTKAFLAAKNLGGLFDIKTKLHPTLNYTKGVIFSWDLVDEEDHDILEGLKSQRVVEMFRIKRRINGEIKNTPTIILTFDCSAIPINVKAGIISIPVREYIPAPMRCRKCFKFGHTKVRCRQTQESCFKCAEFLTNVHVTENCDKIKCVNCEGTHFSNSRDCPVFEKEQKIAEIKTKDKINYREAEKKFFRLYANTTGANKGNYSETLKADQQQPQQKQQQLKQQQQQIQQQKLQQVQQIQQQPQTPKTNTGVLVNVEEETKQDRNRTINEQKNKSNNHELKNNEQKQKPTNNNQQIKSIAGQSSAPTNSLTVPVISEIKPICTNHLNPNELAILKQALMQQDEEMN